MAWIIPIGEMIIEVLGGESVGEIVLGLGEMAEEEEGFEMTSWIEEQGMQDPIRDAHVAEYGEWESAEHATWAGEQYQILKDYVRNEWQTIGFNALVGWGTSKVMTKVQKEGMQKLENWKHEYHGTKNPGHWQVTDGPQKKKPKKDIKKKSDTKKRKGSSFIDRLNETDKKRQKRTDSRTQSGKRSSNQSQSTATSRSTNKTSSRMGKNDKRSKKKKGKKSKMSRSMAGPQSVTSRSKYFSPHHEFAGAVVPRTTKTTLKSVVHESLVVVSSGVKCMAVQVNDVLSPYNKDAGQEWADNTSKAYGHAHYSAIYTHHLVTFAKFRATFYNQSNMATSATHYDNAYNMGFYFTSDITDVVTSMQDAIERSEEWTTLQDHGVVQLGGDINPNEELGISSPMSDDTVNVTISSEPARDMFCMIWLTPVNNSGTTTPDITFELEQTIIWNGPHQLSIAHAPPP